MAEIQLGPTICGTVAWGCGFNMIMFHAIAAKEGWHVPTVALMGTPRLLGEIGIFVSMVVCAAGASWWALLIAPAGGLLFGGLSTAVLQQRTQSASFFLGCVLNLIGLFWVWVV